MNNIQRLCKFEGLPDLAFLFPYLMVASFSIGRDICLYICDFASVILTIILLLNY